MMKSHRIVTKDFVVVAISMGLLILSASFVFESSNKWIFWLYDDTEHLDVASNFFDGRGFMLDMLDKEANTETNNIPTLIERDQISIPLYSKPPLHLLLLGAWLEVTSAAYTNWYFWGSILSLAIAISVVPIYYIFARANFSFPIAAISTAAIAIMPVLIWHSVRIRPEVLAFVFMIAALHFIRRLGLRNILLVGLLTGLAHLTHPTAVILGATILIFLLWKRNFKLMLVFILTWLVVISPWMVRNYIVFGDVTIGLAVPIPKALLAVIGLVSIDSRSYSTDSVTIAYIRPYDTLVGMMRELTDLHGMGPFIPLLALSIPAYLYFGSIKRVLSSRKNAAKFSAVIALYAIIIAEASSIADAKAAFWVQIFTILVLPFVFYLIIRILGRNARIFREDLPQTYTILAILGIVSFIFYILYAQVDARVVPEVRFIVYPLSLIVPVSLVGIIKLVYLIRDNPVWVSTDKLFMVVIAMVVLSFFTFQIATAIPIVNAYQTNFGEKDYQIDMHAWIRENVPAEAKIASDLPHAVVLRTGHPSVNFYSGYKDDVNYERWIIKKFEIDYLVFYYPKSGTFPALQVTDLGDLQLTKVYETNNPPAGYGGFVYRVNEK